MILNFTNGEEMMTKIKENYEYDEIKIQNLKKNLNDKNDKLIIFKITKMHRKSSLGNIGQSRESPIKKLKNYSQNVEKNEINLFQLENEILEQQNDYSFMNEFLKQNNSNVKFAINQSENANFYDQLKSYFKLTNKESVKKEVMRKKSSMSINQVCPIEKIFSDKKLTENRSLKSYSTKSKII